VARFSLKFFGGTKKNTEKTPKNHPKNNNTLDVPPLNHLSDTSKTGWKLPVPSIHLFGRLSRSKSSNSNSEQILKKGTTKKVTHRRGVEPTHTPSWHEAFSETLQRCLVRHVQIEVKAAVTKTLSFRDGKR